MVDPRLLRDLLRRGGQVGLGEAFFAACLVMGFFPWEYTNPGSAWKLIQWLHFAYATSLIAAYVFVLTMERGSVPRVVRILPLRAQDQVDAVLAASALIAGGVLLSAAIVLNLYLLSLSIAQWSLLALIFPLSVSFALMYFLVHLRAWKPLAGLVLAQVALYVGIRLDAPGLWITGLLAELALLWKFGGVMRTARFEDRRREAPNSERRPPTYAHEHGPVHPAIYFGDTAPKRRGFAELHGIAFLYGLIVPALLVGPWLLWVDPPDFPGRAIPGGWIRSLEMGGLIAPTVMAFVGFNFLLPVRVTRVSIRVWRMLPLSSAQLAGLVWIHFACFLSGAFLPLYAVALYHGGFVEIGYYHLSLLVATILGESYALSHEIRDPFWDALIVSLIVAALFIALYSVAWIVGWVALATLLPVAWFWFHSTLRADSTAYRLPARLRERRTE